MTTTLRNAKLNRRFDLYDVDGDGYMELSDFVALAERIATAVGEPLTSLKAKNLKDRYIEFFDGFLSESDSTDDGRISREEYLAVMAKRVNAWSDYADLFRRIAQAVYDIADHDGDGVLTIGEVESYMKAFGISVDEIPAAAARLDANRNGRISHDELFEAYREFLCSDDPAAAGNTAFGRL